MKNTEIGNKTANINIKQQFICKVNGDGSKTTKIITRDYFDATASNWNTSAHSAPSESLCIKTGNQIGGWVFSRFDHVIRGGPNYTNFLASGRGMSVD